MQKEWFGLVLHLGLIPALRRNLDPLLDFIDDVGHSVVLDLLHDRVFFYVLILLSAAFNQVKRVSAEDAIQLFFQRHELISIKVVFQYLAQEVNHCLSEESATSKKYWSLNM